MPTITDKQREKNATYMRGYNRKNRDHINSQRNARNKERALSGPTFRELANARNKRYYKAHKEAIDAKARARLHDPVASKKRRKAYEARYPARVILATRRYRAKKAGLPFNLTEEWYYNNCEVCAVTRMPLDPWGTRGPWTAHIDRKEPSKGYTQDNCQVVCAMYDLAKKNCEHEDVVQMALGLIRISDA